MNPRQERTGSAWPLKACALALALIAMSLNAEVTNTQFFAPLPAALVGNWLVTEVHIDTGATRTPRYQRNDPRLTGRLFSIGRDKLTSNTPEEKLCVNPQASTSSTNAAKLIAGSMAGQGLVPKTPTPQDYELPLNDNARVDAISVSCNGALWAGGLGRNGGIQGAWMIAMPKDRLAIRWYDETILVLSRLHENAKPVASFQCPKATTAVEKTLCGSITLAAFDRSIGESYTSALKQFKDTKNHEGSGRLQAQQKAWLGERNACGSDEACLQKSMEDRLEAIETMMQ